MARFDHGGGCACGLYKVCECEHAAVVTTKALGEAVDTARGNMPRGTRVTFTLKETLMIGGVPFPPGRYKIEKLT